VRAPRPGGGTGLRDGLKIHCPQGHAGSNPAPGIDDAILADDRSTVLVAGEIDGFVAFEPETNEIRALYVAPKSFGQKVGYARDGATDLHNPTGLTEVRMTRESRE
jgi:hypothetical protein